MRERIALDEIFDRWTVIEPPNGQSRKWHVYCRCKCGVERFVSTSSLRRKISRSCGCLTAETMSRVMSTHRQSRTRTHITWKHMRQRCLNQKSKDYPNYGGRGISICRRWEMFENFLADMGECPAGATIEREDNDGDYAPDNCTWVPRCEQNGNKRSNLRLEKDGQIKTLAEWGRVTGIPSSTIQARLTRGWPALRALTEAVHYRGQGKNQ